MRRWLGVGVALALLAAALWYAHGPEGEVSGPTTSEDEAHQPGGSRASRPRTLPVNALLDAPLPSPRGSLHIRGTVVGPEGQPVAGASVVATAPTPHETLSELPCQCDNHCGMKLLQCGCGMAAMQLVELVAERRGEAPPLARTTSDAQGNFSLEGLEAGHYALWADGAFGTALRQDVAAGEEGVELRVGHGEPLSGRILDEDGRPVPGALVTALFVPHSRFFDTLSDAQGRWRLGPLPRGDYNLVFSKEGLLPEHEKVRGTDRPEQEVMLYRPRRLAGQVLHEGNPAAGARVHAEGEHRKLDTLADADGRFTFEGLRPGDYEVSAAHAGLEAIGQALLEPGLDVSDLQLELGAGVRVTGSVRDRLGRPIAEATVSVGTYRGRGKRARTASDGTYSLGPLTPGLPYDFHVEASGYVRPPPLRKEVEASTPVDFVLEDAALIEGRVVDTSGQPLEDVALELFTLSDEEIPDKVHDSRSGKGGAFTLEAPKPGTYQVRAFHKDFVLARQSVPAPASAVQVVMSAGARVLGEVVDEQGLPVPEARVRLIPRDELARYGAQRRATADEQGRFTLQGVDSGEYVIVAWATSEGNRSTAQRLEVQGTLPVQVRLQFPAGLPLEGVVVDEAGEPVAEAQVSIERLMDEEQGAGDELERMYYSEPSVAPTGADGRFQARHVAPGRYWVSAAKKGYALEAESTPGRTHGLEVRAGTTHVRLVLARLGHIRGRVVRADGSPLTRFQVNGLEVVDPLGAFAYPIIESSEKTLTFSAPHLARTTRQVTAKRGVDLELGEVVLDTGRTLRGRVVDASTGSPVAEARVWTRDGDSEVRTGPDGTFTLANLEERPLRLVVFHSEYPRKRLELSARQTEVTVSLEPGVILQGTVRTRTEPLALNVSINSLDGARHASVEARDGQYRIRGLAPGGYMVRTMGLGPDGKRLAFLPQQVELPAQGVMTLDLEESRSPTTLRLRASGGTSSPLNVSLIPGRVSLPSTSEAVDLLLMRAYFSQEENEGSYTFRSLPPGPYTVVMLRPAGEHLELHHEDLELPAEGEVSREVQPRWRRLQPSERPLLVDDVD